MFRSLTTGFYPRFVQKRLGVTPVGAIDTMLLSTGTALLVRNNRPLLGVALLSAGAYRSWKAAREKRCQDCDPA